MIKIDRLQDFPADTNMPSPHFMLFVASDFTAVSDELATSFVRQAIAKGAIWISFWGPDADRMHDRFDEVRTEIDPLEQDEDGVLMASSHDDFFADRFWFFLFATRPAPRYIETCHSRLAVAVGAPKWFSEMHRYLAEPHMLDDITTKHLVEETGPYAPPADDPDESGASV